MKEKGVSILKTKLLSLAMAVLGMPILGHAVTYPSAPAGFCLHAQIPDFLVQIALQILGQFC